MDTAAIHVHTAECAHHAHHPAAVNGNSNGGASSGSSPRPGSPAVHDMGATGQSSSSSSGQGPGMATGAADNGFECDFHCCALHEEGRRIAVHKSVATSPIQECHHSAMQQQQQQQSLSSQTGSAQQQQQQQQPGSSSLSDGTRRASPKGHVRFLDAAGSPPLPPPPLLPPPLVHHAAAGRKQPQQQLHRSDDSSESETETTVIEDDSMTSEKFLLLIDQLTGKQDKHLTVKDIGIILERLNSKIVDVERLDREYEATDCYNWTIKATIRGDVLQELGIIYNGSYYGISEHPGYRQHDGEEEPNEEDDEEAMDDGGGVRADRRRADEEVNI